MNKCRHFDCGWCYAQAPVDCHVAPGTNQCLGSNICERYRKDGQMDIEVVDAHGASVVIEKTEDKHKARKKVDKQGDGWMQRVYIAGKMRGIKYYNFPAFDKAKERLESCGMEVVSPADIDRENGSDPMRMPEDTDWNTVPKGFDFDGCVRRDVDAILSCDAIYMLDGWQDSKGATAEKALAEWRGIHVMYESVDMESELFPSDSKARLTYPVFTGLLMYFPHACAAVAHHSFVGNEQHNPGEPMHWAKEKSVGTGDQIVRHVMEGDLEACAWRALELLERKLTGLPPF